MLTAIFKSSGLINKQNAVFYLGFAFNMVRIIEFNTELKRDKAYLDDLFKHILGAVTKPTHSILFLVLNYFFSPECGAKEDKNTREFKGAKGKLAGYLLNYLNEHLIDVEQLLISLKVTKTGKEVTMTKAMKFISF